MMLCTCGYMIDTDANPEAFYFERPDGKEVELDPPLCDGCKDDKYTQLENSMLAKGEA